MKHQSTWLSRLVLSVRGNFYRCNYWSRAKEDSSCYTHKQERSEKSIERYARYSAYISNARQLCRLGQYPSLDDYNRDMQSLVEHYVSEVLSEQKDGQATLSLSAVGDYYQSENQGFLDHELFQNMMTERPEFETIEENCGDLFINIKSQYLHNQMRELTQQEVDVICAKHVLWLNDAGGERANFQNCYCNLNFICTIDKI